MLLKRAGEEELGKENKVTRLKFLSCNEIGKIQLKIIICLSVSFEEYIALFIKQEVTFNQTDLPPLVSNSLDTGLKMLIIYTLHVSYDHNFNFLKHQAGYIHNTIYILYIYNKCHVKFPIIYQLIKLFFLMALLAPEH